MKKALWITVVCVLVTGAHGTGGGPNERPAVNP